MLRIITDSTCNLPPEYLKLHGVRVAPISIQFGNDAFDEGLTIDRDTFYRKIEELGIIPTTSQPSPGWFTRYYQEAASEGNPVLVVTITSKHSGTYQSAVLAKSIVPGADVEVFDSASISLGTGIQILEAVRSAEAGEDRSSILRRLETIRAGTFIYLTPSTLKYLQMSGRVGKLQGAIASLLNVKPIIEVKDGTLEAIENVRTRAKAIDRLLSLAEESVGRENPVQLAVIHALVPDEAESLLGRAKARFSVKEALTADLAQSLAVHGGPGTIGLVVRRA
jgi:DegV family protein with EDD domain